MFIGYKVQIGNLDGFTPISVSNVETIKRFAPMTVWGKEADDLYQFSGYEVVVTYPGDFIGSGIVKRKLTFNPIAPDHFIGNVKYLPEKQITQVTHIFKVPDLDDELFIEDVRHRVSLFFSLMSCKCQSNENIK